MFKNLICLRPNVKICTEFHRNLSRSSEITGRNSFAPLKPIFTKLVLIGQFLVENYCTEFHENSTSSSVADTRSQTDRWMQVVST